MIVRVYTAILLVLLYPLSAYGQEDSRWVKKLVGRWCDSSGYCRPDYRWHRAAPHVYRSRTYDPGYVQPRWDGSRRCEQVVEVLSTEHTDETKARNAATKLWMAKTQWLYGGSMMDLEFAHEVLWRCSASNAHDTFSGRLVEGIAKLEGKEGQNVRCQLWARPCNAPREPEAARRR